MRKTLNRRKAGKEDRRTKYTKGTIRDAFMELLKGKPFGKITVTDICRLADINRGTFYLHYYDVDDVLDDVLDIAFSDVSSTLDHVMCPSKERCTYPFCQKIQEDLALRPLFMDDSISERIVDRLSEGGREPYVSYLMENCGLSKEEAEALFIFQINGCLTINRHMLKTGTEDWQQIQRTIDGFIRSGLEGLGAGKKA